MAKFKNMGGDLSVEAHTDQEATIRELDIDRKGRGFLKVDLYVKGGETRQIYLVMDEYELDKLKRALAAGPKES